MRPLLLVISPKPQANRGFTLIEMLIAFGILLLLSGVGSLYMASTRSAAGLDSSARKIIGILSAARENAITQEENSRWGVYVDNRNERGSFILYKVDETLLAAGDATVPGISIHRLTLDINTRYASPTATTYSNIIFAKGTGIPNASTTIVLEQTTKPDNTKTISIENNGHIDAP